MQVWQDVVSVIISNGIFAVLFVILFCYQLKDSKNREEKYQKTIADLTDHLGVIDEIKEDIKYLKENITPKRRKKDESQESSEIL